MLKNISLQKKLMLVMGVLILISMIIGGLISYDVVRLESTLASVEKAQNARNQVLAFERNVSESHINLSEFVNSGDLSKRDQYEKIWSGLEQMQTALSETVSAVSPDMQGKLVEVYGHLGKWEEQIVARQLLYMRAPNTVDLARLYEASEENARIWDDIEGGLGHVTQSLDTIMAQKTSEQHEIMTATRLTVMIGNILTVAAAVIASIFLVRTISKPLAELVAVTGRLVKKDWSVRITGTDRKDEVGQMANALLLFRDNGQENERLQEVQKLEDAKRLERAQRIEALVAGFRDDSAQTTSALEKATTDMKSASVSMTQIAAETSNLSSRVARAANDTGSNVQSVSAATEELTASINEISEQLNKTSQQAVSAQRAAETAVTQMQTLEASVNDIGNVIQIITDIAEQTNLLALNATIESARAGEAGKGFAVVANEVKTLANETGKATEQVRHQIEEMQRQTSKAVDMIENISKVIEELTAASSSIAVAMEEQTSATQEISRNVSEAAMGTDEVVNSINQVNLATEETGSTAAKVSAVSEELSSRSDTLKSSIRTFIEAIKAA